MSENARFSARRIAADGILIALFFLLSLLSFEVGGVKLTLDAFPVLIAAVLFGPIDGFLVGLLGAFLEQMAHFGFTATTALWILPPAIRGLAIGLGLKKAQLGSIRYFAVNLFAALLVSCGNTAVFYADSKLFGYYQYSLIFGVFFWRIISSLLTGAVIAAIALPVFAALKKSGIGKDLRL